VVTIGATSGRRLIAMGRSSVIRPPAPTRSYSPLSVSGTPPRLVMSTLSSPRSVSPASSWLKPLADAPTATS
jgi:hypothetical protein